MTSGSRFGVYLPEDLAKELDECMKSMGITSKSRILQEALRLFIAEYKWKNAKSVVGAIGVLYNHEINHIDDVLTDIQHEFLDIIVSALHVHLDKEKCMLLIVVKGDAERVKSLVDSISSLKGVLLVRPLLLEAK